MTVAGVLLAAGAGTRFGTPKALVEFRGESLLRRGERLLREAGCAPVLVVIGARADDVVAANGPREYVVAKDWETGMGASLRAALTALAARPEGRKIDAAVVALVDQPLVEAEAIRRLVAARDDGAAAAVATYAGHPRNPVLLGREVWAEIGGTASGDVGARRWLTANADRVTRVACDGVGVPDDADTPEELLRLEGMVH